MDPVISHLLAAAGGLVAGIAGAWLFLRRRGSAGADAEKQLDEYRRQVAEHFARTSKLVDGMTDSYKAVFDELQEGAHSLLPPEQLRELLADQSEEVITLSRLSYRQAPAGTASSKAAAKPAADSPAPSASKTSAPAAGQERAESPVGDDPPATRKPDEEN